MTRHCARPGCHGLASATLSYHYPTRTGWLDFLSPEAHPTTHDLCDHHADRFTVPMGWELVDRRIATTLSLFGESLAS